MITRKHIIDIIGECNIDIFDYGCINVYIKEPSMDRLLMLYDYCYNYLPISQTITTSEDNKLKYSDFVRYKLNLDLKDNK